MTAKGALLQEADKSARAAIQRLLAVRDYLQQDVVKLARARSQRAAAADDACADQAQANLEVCHTRFPFYHPFAQALSRSSFVVFLLLAEDRISAGMQ